MKNRLLVLWLGLAVLGATQWCAGAERVWHGEKGFKWAEPATPSGGQAGFTLLPPKATGLAFTNALDERELVANSVLPNGSGVAVGDFDNDGLPDLFLCSLEGRNTLYKNLGNWKFQDVTAATGLVCTNRYTRGAVFADVNGDGALDLLVTVSGRGVLVFLNDGHGKFTDATAAAGTASKFGSATLALADVDGNGTLDLYVANYRAEDIRDRDSVKSTVIQMVRGKPSISPSYKDRLVIIDGRLKENGEPDVLYLNDGKGHFTPVSWTGGTFLDEDGKPLADAPRDWGLTAAFRDINGDGFPDLYVCNDYWTPDRIWINDGRGHFRAIDRLAMRHMSASSMGVDFADLNRTGHTDFLVVDMLSRDHRQRKRQEFVQRTAAGMIGIFDDRPQVLRNTLMQNRGDGTFADIADLAGLSASDWAWQPVFLDVYLDGYEDVLITSGNYKDLFDMDAEERIKATDHPWPKGDGLMEYQGKMMTVREAYVTKRLINARQYPRLDSPIVSFRNLGQYRFQETTAAWGLNAPGVHHGIALADLDGDGDLDFVVNNLGAPASVFRNNTSAPRVALRLAGNRPNTQGIGAKIKLLGGAVPMQSQEVISGGRYQSGSEPLLVFAAGKSTGDMTIEVTWRNGRISRIPGVVANRIYEIEESIASEARPAPVPGLTPIFKDVSSVIDHTHFEESFDDYARQPLLPHKLSQLGPAVAWYDLDGDGHDDLIVGSGRGGALSFFRGDGKGALARMESAAGLTLPDDATGLVGWTPEPGRRALLVGRAGYEETNHPAVVQVDFTAGGLKAGDTLPGNAASAGPLAVADFDGDGRLDLFVGGRVLPGRFPEAASSRIFHHDGKRLRLDVENSRVLENVGLVSGAVWSDLDGDGFPELILACQWGPVRAFKNQAGKLSEITAALGLDKYAGWWNSVTTGDLDGDGRPDIIAGNWGLNCPWPASEANPARIFYGNFGAGESLDLIEAATDPATGIVAPVRMLNSLAASMPFLRARFTTHQAYSEASVADVIGPPLTRAREVRASTMASMVFLNRGTNFGPFELPFEAQVAPVFSINVADVDGDGHEDVFLSQNFFTTRPEIPRHDAGRGLWLRGDGTGKLRAIPGQESGVKVYGEQRGAALADFNEDGRIDLVVTQNGSATRLFQNVTAKPGLRVRLAGPPGNPAGVGASVRLKFSGRLGPAREIHAGSGYWSQDSAVQVMGGSERPSQLLVRWPGGQSTTTDVPLVVRDITVSARP